MSCNLTTSTTSCVQCIHPFDYLFELAQVGRTTQKNIDTFSEILDRLLEKGIVQPNCGICCPDCNGLYAVASVETMLKLFEIVLINVPVPAIPSPLSAVSQGSFEGCCSNIIASIETYLTYSEAVITEGSPIPANPSPLSSNVSPLVTPCCNGFTECVDELLCWVTQNTRNPYEAVDRTLDKGIVEFGNIVNNCTNTIQSSICKLVQLLIEYISVDSNPGTSSNADIIDRILDKGIVVYCDPTSGDIVIASVETWLKYYEAIYFPSALTNS
jgi:hypothetical protein